MSAETLLDFPTCHIRINYHRILWSNNSSTRTYDYNGFFRFTDLLPCSSHLIRIQIIFQPQIGDIAE